MPIDPTVRRQRYRSRMEQARTLIPDLTAALKALPAPESRTAAQRRDALLLRSVRCALTLLVLGSPQEQDDVDDSGS